MAQLTAHLCGNFSVEEKSHTTPPAFWKEVCFTDDELTGYRRYYYPEFVDFCLVSTRHYRHVFDGGLPCSLNFRGKEIAFTVDALRLMTMPCGIMTYAISVSCESENLNDFTALTASLRTIDTARQYCHEDYTKQVLEPLEETLRLMGNGTQLMEQGNKLRLFQIIDSITTDDVTLFQLGTCSAVTADIDAPGALTREYMDSVLKQSRLSVYNNWTALALLDSFTILCHNTEAWQKEVWTDDYFQLIYCYSLFAKFYLQRINKLFRSDLSLAGEMAERVDQFETHCCFHKVSYNFLPVLVAEACNKALALDEEKELLHSTITMEKNRQEKVNDETLNNFLLFLTLVSAVSAVWDMGCLMERMVGFGNTATDIQSSYRMVVGLVLTSIITVLLIMFRKRWIKKSRL